MHITSASRRYLAAAIAGLCAAMFSSVVSASVSIPVEFRELVARADLIVRGRVTDVRALTTPGFGVESAATVAVDRILKGRADRFLSVRVPGGQVGRYRTVMVGAPVLHVGESAVFFLVRGADGALRPLGLASGVFDIEADPATGQLLVHPPVVALGRTPTGPIVRGDARRPMLSVPDFEGLVGVVLTARVAGPRGAR